MPLEASCAQNVYDVFMEMGARVSEIGSLLGDSVRAAMLTTLMDGRALPAGKLAFIGNVAPQTASFHLGKLLDSHLLVVERQGKHKYYRLANEHVALAIESLAAIGPLPSEARSRTADYDTQHHNQGLQHARSCYKHLAGRLAIQLHEALIARQFIQSTRDRQYELTDAGETWLTTITPKARQPFGRRDRIGRACMDWTERRHHLAGPLGVILLSRMLEANWLLQRPGTRALAITPKGRQSLDRQLGIR